MPCPWTPACAGLTTVVAACRPLSCLYPRVRGADLPVADHLEVDVASTPACAGLTMLPPKLGVTRHLYPRVRGADTDRGGSPARGARSTPACAGLTHWLTCDVSRLGVSLGSLPRWWPPGEP